ncbi:major capsid protein [Pseudomonas phage Psp6]|nr:major capsid protein [Pseudomonas phage Psp6]
MAQIDEEYKEIQANLKKVGDDLKVHSEASKAAVEQHVQLSKETKESVDKLYAEQTQLKADLKVAEQLLAKLDSGEGKTRKSASLGELFIAAEGLEEFCGRAAGGAKASFTMPIKAAITSLPGSAGVNIQPDRLGMVLPLQQRLFIRDLLAAGTTTSNALEFVRESGFTNNANVVSENPTNPKPESDITFELDSVPVATIAHWVRASRQVLSDIPMLRGYIDGRLRYGLKLKEELQLLKGSGVGLNITGIETVAQNYVNPGVVVAGETAIDRLRIAMLQVTLAELDPDGIVLSPIDWTAIELLKDGELRYLFTQPQGVATPTLWGKPVVPTQAQDAGDFLVGSFQQGAQIWDREQINVTVSTEDRDNFVKNMVTILCEERVGLTIYREEAFVKGQLPTAS